MVTTRNYDTAGPFGEVFCSVGDMAKVNPFQFSTKYTDSETDLVYYGYRYYSPALGRWLSRDPIEERGGLNLYAFVNNDPVNRWDKLGLQGMGIMPIYSQPDFPNFDSRPPKDRFTNPIPPTPTLSPNNKCMLEVCCRHTGLRGSHCVIRFTYPNGKVSGCRGGPEGNRFKKENRGKKSDHCKGDCGGWGNIVAGCGTGYNDEERPLQLGLWKDLKDAENNPHHCTPIAYSESVCSWEPLIDQKMKEITSKCYIYRISGPNSNTTWHSALQEVTGFGFNPRGWQPGRLDSFSESERCEKGCNK
ncbi:MAG: RHS repeat-associated core domain-containing protein [Verrucomicrobiae bacterium]|nr:RHS repeat-associated core domain-containing protein [Verrucomicrobiae bacterium]